jgi:hypothetical protein
MEKRKEKKEKVIVDAPAAFVRRVLDKAALHMVCAHFCFTLACEDGLFVPPYYLLLRTYFKMISISCTWDHFKHHN